jgi:PKD repeat protein
MTSVVVYTGSTFGDSYQNKVFIADYSLGWIKELTFDSEYTSFIGERMFDDQAGTTVKLVQGPDGNLYQLTIYPGELSRIAPSGGNVAPTAVITATPNNGLAPLTVNFSSDGSNDTESPTPTYAWNFGTATPRPRPTRHTLTPPTANTTSP